MAAKSKVMQFIKQHQSGLLILAIIFYILIFALVSLWKYQNFFYNALDLAIINQAFYNSAQGDWFGSSIHPPSYWGDHFSPIILLLLPFYLIKRVPQTLLVLQSIILGLSAWPLYLIAKTVLGKNFALIIASAWLVNPVVQNTNLFEFSLLPAAIFFLFWVWYFYQRKNFLGFLIFSTLALLVREDASLVIIMFGLLGWWQKRNWQWLITPILLGVGYFIGALTVSKNFAPDQSYKFFIYYPWLPELLTRPWLPIFYLLRINNLIYLAGLGLTLVFIPFLSPLYLLPGLIISAQLILGSSGGSQTLLETHYSSLLLPTLFVAAVYGWQKIINHQPTKLIRLINQYQQLTIIIFVVGVIYSSLTLGPLLGVWQKINAPSATTAKQELINLIPKDAAVAAGYDLLAQLSSRPKIYSFNYAFLGKQQFLSNDYNLPPDTEFLAVDFADFVTYQIQYGQNLYYQSQYHQALQQWPEILDGYGLIFIDDTLALFKKGSDNIYQLLSFLDQPPINQNQLKINDNITFLGYQKNDQTYQLIWQFDLPLPKSYQLKLEITDSEQTVYQKIYPLAYDLLIGQEPNTKIVQTNYWFNLKKTIPPGNYRLKLSVIEITGGGIEVDGVRSTKNVIDEERLIGQIINEPITL